MSQHKTLSWLSTVGDYDRLVHDLVSSDPRLRRRDPKAQISQSSPWKRAPAKAVVFHASPEAPFRRPALLHDANELLEFLDAGVASHRPDERRVVILQGLNPRFVGAVGSHFRMHPSFFVEHERVVVVPRATETTESDVPVLPSLLVDREHVTLKYYEVLEMPEELMGPGTLCCADSGRHIAVTQLAESFSTVGVVRRKCSIWSRQRKGGKGWDVVILTDPPVKSVQMKINKTREIVDIIPVPVQGGYISFLPHPLQIDIGRGPPRTCMMDDMCFYLEAISFAIDADRSNSIALLAKKIIASHYMQHADFLKTVISNTQWHMAHSEAVESFGFAGVEGQWSAVQTLERRMAEYCQDLEWLMFQCSIPLDPPSLKRGSTWEDVTADFQFIYTMYSDLRNRAISLNSSIAALAGMAGNRHALQETKSAKALTVIGLIFIPLAYVSSLFSMADDYMPGAVLFWVYFAVSVPMIVLVFIAYLIIDLLYYGSLPGWVKAIGGSKSGRRQEKDRHNMAGRNA